MARQSSGVAGLFISQDGRAPSEHSERRRRSETSSGKFVTAYFVRSYPRRGGAKRYNRARNRRVGAAFRGSLIHLQFVHKRFFEVVHNLWMKFMLVTCNDIKTQQRRGFHRGAFGYNESPTSSCHTILLEGASLFGRAFFLVLTPAFPPAGAHPPTVPAATGCMKTPRAVRGPAGLVRHRHADLPFATPAHDR